MDTFLQIILWMALIPAIAVLAGLWLVFLASVFTAIGWGCAAAVRKLRRQRKTSAS